MAAYLTRSQVAERGLSWTVDSAGLHSHCGEPMAPHAAEALTRRFVPLSGHQSKQLSADLVADADIILVMSAGHAVHIQRHYPDVSQKVYELGQFAGDDVPGERGQCDIVDPYGMSTEAYENCANLITACVHRLLDYLMSRGACM